MKIWTCIAIALSTATSYSAQAQPENGFTFIDSISVNGYLLSTDQLDNVYVATGDHQIIKYDPKGREQFRYSDNFLGKVGTIDAFNPLQLLVYYPEFLTVVTLDRTLNPLATFDLMQLEYQYVDAVARAGNGELWIYDAVRFRLRKINSEGKVLVESNDLSLQFPQGIQVLHMREQQNMLYAQTEKQGVLVFNLFGAYVRSIPIPKGAETYIPVQFRENSIIIFGQDNIYIRQKTVFEGRVIKWRPVGYKSSITGARFSETGQLILLSDNKVARFGKEN